MHSLRIKAYINYGKSAKIIVKVCLKDVSSFRYLTTLRGRVQDVFFSSFQYLNNIIAGYVFWRKQEGIRDGEGKCEERERES